METERLLIRRFSMDDIEGFAQLIRDKMASPYARYDHSFPTDDGGLRDVLGFFSESDEFWAVQLKESRKIIGFISLNHVDSVSRNLGYCLHTGYHGMGYAQEAAKRIIRFARDELGLEKLVTGTAKENQPSVRLLERLGFARIGEGSYELELSHTK